MITFTNRNCDLVLDDDDEIDDAIITGVGNSHGNGNGNDDDANESNNPPRKILDMTTNEDNESTRV
jgi:hypothetical protein